MRKLYLILIGVFILGIVGAISFGLSEDKFNTKINKIKAEKYCEKYEGMPKVEKEECKELRKGDYEIDTSQISIKYDNESEVYQVKAQ